MEEIELRKHRCCFTGHRPEKLRLSERKLATLLEAEIKRAIAGGFIGAALNKKLPEKTVEKAFNGVQLLVLAICVFNIIRNIR